MLLRVSQIVYRGGTSVQGVIECIVAYKPIMLRIRWPSGLSRARQTYIELIAKHSRLSFPASRGPKRCVICLRCKVDVTVEEMNIAEIPCAVWVGDLLQDVGDSALCWIERFYLRQIAAH